MPDSFACLFFVSPFARVNYITIVPHGEPIRAMVPIAQRGATGSLLVRLYQDNYKELFGALDNAFLVAYAIGMYISGIFGERLPLRYYLSGGMLLSGLFTCLFGLGYYWNIHQLWYFVLVQIFNGLVQTTGWPSVVACVGNWFGKGKRGFIMGIWNSHTSVGNILGSLIAGTWVSSAWGLSFIVPGIIIGTMGVICFLFLIEYPEDVDCSPPLHHVSSSDEKGLEAGHSISDASLNISTHSRENIIDVSENIKELPEDREAITLLQTILLAVDGFIFPSLSPLQGVVEFSFCLLFAKLVSYTFLYWLPLYIVNVAHLSAKEAGDMSTLFDVGGIVEVFVSDHCVFRNLSTTWHQVSSYQLAELSLLFLYNYIGQNGLGTSIVMLIICGGLVNGPYALITTAVSADLGTHESLQGNSKALSTVTAIIDGTGSVGAALGPLLAGLISSSSWDNVFYMLISADVLACLYDSSASPALAFIRISAQVDYELFTQNQLQKLILNVSSPFSFCHVWYSKKLEDGVAVTQEKE
ncbi:hypothetical protein JD844_031296, partial [Phrynosoma platyrhinos]